MAKSFLPKLLSSGIRKIEVEGNQIRCWIDDNLLFTVTDIERPLNGGGVALVCIEGMLLTDAVTIAPLKPAD